ncbi:MAG: hypothetical protein ACO1RX_21755 [Candidatus Sericytochromatia bacterium]
MNMQELALMQAKQAGLSAQRQSKAAALCQQGLRALAQAQSRRFRDKAALEQAHALLLKAMKQDRRQVPAYIGIAYLRLILGDNALAMKYVRMALRLAPQDPQAQALFLQLSGGNDHTAAESEGAEAALDALTLQITSQGQQLSREEFPQTPLTDRTLLAVWQQRHQRGIQAHAESLARLLALEPLFETASLRLHLQAQEKQLERWGLFIRLSTEYQVILAQIAAHLNSLKSLQQQVARGTEHVGPQLESLLDSCDALADRLDGYEAQGYVISPLLSAYQDLIERVSALQDALDEHGEMA